MKRIFVDTGAWYALIDREDPDHSVVQGALVQCSGRLVTSNFVFDETVTLLRYRLGWSAAHTFGEKLRAGTVASLAEVTKKDQTRAWAVFTRYRDKSFSFTDCTSFSLMERLGVDTAIAIDGDFRAYGMHCLPIENV